MQYFGTDPNSHGHYLWTLADERMHSPTIDFFKTLPFNPEEMPRSLKREKYDAYEHEKGYAAFYKEHGYSIWAINGSCVDTRPGTKSVFFIKEDLTAEQLKERILATPIAVRIIEKMPFKINW